MSRRGGACISSIVPILAGVAAAWTTLAASQVQIRVSVDVVELNVAVTQGNRPVAGLTAGDFDVTDNGVRQKVTSVTRETTPIDVTFVVDTSESVSDLLARAIVNAIGHVRDRLRPADRVSVVAFNSVIYERLSLARPGDIRNLTLGGQRGQTSLNDAIAVALAIPPVADRRQMAIVFTDGYDSTSILGEADVLEIAGRSPTAVFLVSRAPGLPSIPSMVSREAGGKGIVSVPGGVTRMPVEFFERLATATGGVTILAPSFGVVTTGDDTRRRMTLTPNVDLLSESFLRAFEDFRTSYLVRYTPEGVARAGWHDVTVSVTRSGRYQVRNRSGYIGG
jgi:hypothetical protein